MHFFQEKMIKEKQSYNIEKCILLLFKLQRIYYFIPGIWPILHIEGETGILLQVNYYSFCTRTPAHLSVIQKH